MGVASDGANHCNVELVDKIWQGEQVAKGVSQE